MSEFTIDQLEQAMRDGAGADEDGGFGAGALDMTFSDLGYDSVMVMEVISRVERSLPVAIPESEWQEVVDVESSTPREFLRMVNRLVA
jgi:act minimal PKS acyl carrier protein